MTPSLNETVAGITTMQRYLDNYDRSKQYRLNNHNKIKQYQLDNTDRIKQQKKQYCLDKQTIQYDKKQTYYFNNSIPNLLKSYAAVGLTVL